MTTVAPAIRTTTDLGSAGARTARRSGPFQPGSQLFELRY